MTREEAKLKTNKKRRPELVDNRLKDIQHEVLVAVASGTPLPDVMTLLCTRVEEITPASICSVIRVDSEGRLRPLAAPSLPDEYSRNIDGLAIGPMIGSCGSAAYYGEPIEVSNIRTDPRWADFRNAALDLGLKACWSSPIKSHDGRVVGTFAFYFSTPRKPSRIETYIVEHCAHLCALAIEHWDAQARIHHLAYTDALTGLGNRALLTERFSDILARAEAVGKEVAVFYIDLDGFRTINDLQGHKAGDQLLCRIADRIRSIAGDADLIARLGSDEFLLVKTEAEDRGEFVSLAERLSEQLSGRYVLDGDVEVKAAASIGVVCFPGDGQDLDSLMGHADTALYRVKRENRSGYAFYSCEMDAEKHARRSFERDVSLAAAAGQLSVVYQPQADAESCNIVGFEALLRWQHPIHGFVSPEKFVPAAEACGAISEMGAFVLREALAQAARWPKHLRVSVNASPAQIVHANFAQLVEETLRAANVDPSRLEIEVTESLFIYDSNAATKTLERMKALGVSVAIDDFGTGYSSLSTLRSFPFDRIKIDRSFVADMVENTDAAAIVNSILSLGRALGRPVIAEGVETRFQLEMLRELGCGEVQGYLIGKPLPIAKYAPIVKPAPKTVKRARDVRPKRQEQAIA